MTADPIAPAILQYIAHSAYPEAEDVASADISTNTLAALSLQLIESQEEVKREICVISKNGSSDIDSWLSRAKKLQADILRSQETARQIVTEAEVGEELKSKVDDNRKKTELLETEVAFQETVEAKLDHIKSVKNLLERGNELMVTGQMVDAVRMLENGEESIKKLGQIDGSSFGSLLARRASGLRERLEQAVNDGWNVRVRVEVDKESVTIEHGIEVFIKAAKELGTSKELLERFVSSFEKAVIGPRLSGDRKGAIHGVVVTSNSIGCGEIIHDVDTEVLFKEIKSILDFLADHFPTDLTASIVESLIPSLSARLEEEWLEPAVPLEISELMVFQQLLQEVRDFVDYLRKKQWHGGVALQTWVDNASPTWIRKRREAILGQVRNLVFTGLRATKVVERVETHVVSEDEDIIQTVHRGDDEDWDTAWDESDETTSHVPSLKGTAEKINQDEDDSAWDVPAEEEEEEDTPSHQISVEEGEEEEDAWGWGDGDEAQPQKNTASTGKGTRDTLPDEGREKAKRGKSSTSHEISLRETFTVTSIPDDLLALIQNIISDAETLNSTTFDHTPLASASVGLYLLPNLALAIYRATAPTAYTKHLSGNGNMLIYNDTLRLSSSLESWQSKSHPSLRLTSDLAHLAQFAKRAYTSEMDSQRIILTDFLSSAQGFSNSTVQPFRAECEAAIEQTIDRLKEVYTQWQPLLSTSALLQSVGSLLHTVTSLIISQIKDLPDIGEAESSQLKGLCERVFEARHLFITGPDNISDETRDMTFVYCPSWLKFQYLAEILESSLADIKYLWNEGELSLEFDAEEVIGLIEALFAESQLRRSATAEIRRSQRSTNL